MIGLLIIKHHSGSSLPVSILLKHSDWLISILWTNDSLCDKIISKCPFTLCKLISLCCLCRIVWNKSVVLCYPRKKIRNGTWNSHFQWEVIAFCLVSTLSLYFSKLFQEDWCLWLYLCECGTWTWRKPRERHSLRYQQKSSIN